MNKIAKIMLERLEKATSILSSDDFYDLTNDLYEIYCHLVLLRDLGLIEFTVITSNHRLPIPMYHAGGIRLNRVNYKAWLKNNKWYNKLFTEFKSGFKIILTSVITSIITTIITFFIITYLNTRF
ncbi:MAG: hypothetical protein LBH05_02470 [Deferribacteraceae bacterium]|nr:hypothetical protein [Deferribacteraceae bacterium]